MPEIRPYRPISPSDWLLTSDGGIAQARDNALQNILNDRRELIRQWVLKELIESYKYPEDWLGTRIVAVGPNNDGPYPHQDAFFGFCVLTTDNRPFLWVSISDSDHADEAGEILKAILLADRYAGMGMYTDGFIEHTKFLRRRFDSDKCDYILNIETYTSPSAASSPWLHRLSRGVELTHKDQQVLIPLTERVENVLFEAHSHIRDIDGMHSDEALDELCKVLYAKLYDEENASRQGVYRMQRWLYGSNEEFAATVRSIYYEANEYDVRVFSLKIPGYMRSRGVFATPIRLSSTALTRVAETLQDYDLTRSGIDIKGRAFQKVLGPGIRAGMGQYFTPHSVIEFMVSVAEPSLNDLVLDPFCGSAHFLTACLQFLLGSGQSRSDKSWYEFAFGKLHGIEKSDRMVRVAMTDMRLHGDGHSNIRCTDALLAFENYPDLQSESFDLILTNPPFGSLLGAKATAQLGKFALAIGRKNVPLEVLGLERCIQFLQPGGRLGIILPDGLLGNRQTKYVRDWLEHQAKLRAIVSLPIETFSPFGAGIKTSIIFMRKWRQGEEKRLDYPVFLARVDNVGYDASGRGREESDLQAVAREARIFLQREGW